MKHEFSEDEDEDEDEELSDLPLEITKLLGKDKFESEEELQKALNVACVGDLRVVLVDGKPRQVMPGEQHHQFTLELVGGFNIWARNKWGHSAGTYKIFLRNGRSHEPDISYWGYPLCKKNPETGLVRPVDAQIPDVVIQFSWKNQLDYEVNAIDDMMNQGLESSGEGPSMIRPRLGYLIKVRFSRIHKKRTPAGVIRTQDMVGLDIYRLPYGTTVADARGANKHNAEHWCYVPGGPDVLITIKPEHLGITGLWAVLCGEYTIKASYLFKLMDEHHTKTQTKGCG